jgi:hypothetical protein
MRLVAIATVALCAACPPPPAPNADATAKFLALANGAKLKYAVTGGVIEEHDVEKSTVLPSSDNKTGLVFDMLATSGGFQVDERTLTFELSPDDARIARFNRCTPVCGQPKAPIPMFAVPLTAGDSKETDVDVVDTDQNGTQSTVHEKHTFVVGDVGSFTVPAGTFQAFTVTWTRVQGTADAETATLRIAADHGIIGWTGFDGKDLNLQ